QYNLKVENPVGCNGVYLPTEPIFAGEHIYKANPKIIESLGAVGRFWAHKPIKHSYPHCWRQKTPIIFRATRQWIFRMVHIGFLVVSLNCIVKVIVFVNFWGFFSFASVIVVRPE
ncbi:isoleucine--tRNA ligase, partial [Acinetobacter baumannii]